MYVPPQSKGSVFVGGVKVLAQRVQVYVSLATFLMISSLWYLRIKEIKVSVLGFTLNFGVVPFWAFMASLVAAFVIIMVADYVYILPSELLFQLRQQYVRNPVVRDIKEIRERLDRIERRLEYIERMLKST